MAISASTERRRQITQQREKEEVRLGRVWLMGADRRKRGWRKCCGHNAHVVCMRAAARPCPDVGRAYSHARHLISMRYYISAGVAR